MDRPRWLTVQQIAQLLEVDEEKVLRLLREGKLRAEPSRSRPSLYRILEADLRQFMRRSDDTDDTRRDTSA
jgi:excisionase family DNA binding protein